MTTDSLKQDYLERIVPALTKEFGYKSVMEVPRLEKIVLNQGLGIAVADKKIIDTAIVEMTTITGQKAVPTLSKKDVAAIAAEMQSLVQQQIPIQMATLPLDKARRIFKQQGNLDKEGLMRWTGFDPVVLYRCAGLYGYFGGPLAANTGMIKVFDLSYYAPGFLLLFPSITAPNQLPPLQVAEKLMNV